MCRVASNVSFREEERAELANVVKEVHFLVGANN
tara:strand:- start:11 stop:112 length:102 start_codon:yes stop_codon:yes gene_type:complete